MDKVKLFNKAEKNFLWQQAKKYVAEDNIDGLISTMNRLERKAGSREKKEEARVMLSLHNADYDINGIFFVCSAHKNPAKDHKTWEGKVYYNRDWRKKELPGWVVEAVSKYIVKHGCKSVQWALGKPVYLTTRPYCRHFFTEVETLKVLTENVEVPLVGYRKTKRGATREWIMKNIEQKKEAIR